MADELEVAIDLAEAAGRLISENLTRAKSVDFKSAVDLVTSVDTDAEQTIVSGLSAAFPSHHIVAEETSSTRPAGGACWYIDPIDGTCNFVHGLPHCSVSIALHVDGVPRVAVVNDPCKGELFTATAGGGARLNGELVSVSATPELDKALFVTGFPYDRRSRADLYLPYFEAFIRNCQDVRRLGSAALDLCWVAAGRFDGFWEWGLHPWDTAAGWLIVSEAGGVVSDFDGSAFDPWAPRILASNGLVHESARDLLADVTAAVNADA